MRFKTIYLTLLLGIVCHLSGCAWWADKQRQIIYRPTPASVAEQQIRDAWPAGAISLRLNVPSASKDTEQSLEAWWWPQREASAPAVLYLHGTFRNLEGNQKKILALHQAGFAVFAVDYRGWGRSSTITPSEQTIVSDAWLAWQAFQTQSASSSKRFVHGHSMGGAAAVQLVSRIESEAAARGTGCALDGMILEATFSSMRDVARREGFWGWVLSLLSVERFDSHERIASLKTPLLVLHGEADKTIAIELGRKLFEQARSPKQWVAFPGGTHSLLQEEQPQLYKNSLQQWSTQTKCR